MKYTVLGDPRPVGLAGLHLGQDLTKDDRVKAMLLIHANIFHVHLVSIDEEQLAVLAQGWLCPWSGVNIACIINEHCWVEGEDRLPRYSNLWNLRQQVSEN